MMETLVIRRPGDVLDHVALDELAFSPGAETEGGRSDAVDVAQAAYGRLVDHGDGVGGEELP